ncbi:MAG: STT3 domain-containing protein, partial [Candidatus Woesearchaeota archaeon]|nr:STT3 domain-containing protein [Candidatus Woesearchaeota archaeon]
MEEEKDDEISLDFGKIKNFFKRKENEENARKSEISGTNSVGNPGVHAGMGDKGTEIKQESNQHIGAKQEGQTKDDDKITIDAQKSKSSGIPENSDEEFSLDFGWVKNIFKGKDPATEEKEEKAETKDDDEISIDFSKIKNLKNIFKKDKDIEFGNTEDENISLDFKKVLGFFVEHRVLIFLLIPIFLSIFLRVQPAYLPITDEWAINSVINNLKSQVSSQINQQYPNLPDQNKNALVENELQKVLREQKSQIDQQITATSNFFKSRLQDDTGQTYLLAIDPYFWMRHAQNVIKKGNPGDEIRDGQQWDNHMYAPNGRGLAPDMFHAYFEAFLFKFLSFFNKNLNLMAAVFFVPVLISALAVIPTFFITRKLVGNLGGVIAATVIAIHPSFLTRTVGGFADTDAYNVTFPLFIAWLFLEALESKSTKNSVILSTINGLLVGLYAFTWGGWWYIFDFILISIVLYIAYYTFIHKKELIGNFTGFIKQKEVKNSLIFLAIFFIVSALSTSAFVSLDHFTRFAKNPAGFARLKEVGITTIWPNVFTTVAEQNPASLDNVIKQVGLGGTQIIGTNFPIFFLISLMGITLTLTTKGHKKIWFVIGALTWYIIIFLMDVQNLNTFLVLISIPIIIRIIIALWESDVNIDIKYAIFLILWFIATTYASTKGVRFTLLLVPAFAIGFGIALGELYRYANVWIAKGLHVNKFVSKMTVMIVILLLLVPTYSSAKRTAEQEIPSFNDAWAISLEKIKSESEPNAIINSWWDFGHW